jgi:hypothetical protein
LSFAGADKARVWGRHESLNVAFSAIMAMTQADRRLRNPDMTEYASNRRISLIVQYITKDAGA